MKPDFMDRTAKIIAEIRNRTCIDDDVEVLEAILQDALREYYDELQKYYDAGYDTAYDEGHSDGYGDGYGEGYDEGRSEAEHDE